MKIEISTRESGDNKVVEIIETDNPYSDYLVYVIMEFLGDGKTLILKETI